MADMPVIPSPDYGPLISNLSGATQADQLNAATGRMSAMAGIPQQLQSAALLGGEAQGQNIKNYMSAMQLQAMQSYLHTLSQTSDQTSGQEPAPTGGAGVGMGAMLQPGAAPASPLAGAPGAPGAPGGLTPQQIASTSPNAPPGTPFDPAAESTRMDQLFSSRYRVDPAYTPREQQLFNAANGISLLTGNKAYLQNVQTQHDIRVQNETAQARFGAQQAYDKAYSLATAPPGTAFKLFERINPAAAKQLAQRFNLDPDHPNTWTPQQLKAIDQHVRQYAEMANTKLFQYTGDTLAEKNGITVNSRTGLPPIGSQQQGLAPKDYAHLAVEGATPVKTNVGGAPAELPLWKVSGYPNLHAWVAAQPGVPGGAPGATAAAGGAQGTPGAVSAPRGAPPPNPVGGAAVNTTDPTLKAALADPTFKVQPQTPPPGVGLTPGQTSQQEALVSARTDATKGAQALTDSSAQALTFIRAAQAVLKSPSYVPTGLRGPVAAAMSRITQALGVNQGNWATKYQEVAKYLGNLAVQNFKQNFGSKPANAEFQIQMRELNPSAAMTPQAIAELLDTNAKIAQYGIQSAQRLPLYLRNNGDPQEYAEWNQKYWPREKYVTETPQTPNTSGVAPTPAPATPAGIPSISTEAQYNALPAGSHYRAPDGKIMIKRGG